MSFCKAITEFAVTVLMHVVIYIYVTGNMIKFRSGALTRIKSNMQLKMLITNTKVGRNTKALVASVSERTFRHPDAMTAVFTAVDSISNKLATIIESPASDECAITEKEVLVEELMEMNQGLLQCMGVSHASIETVIRTTLKYKLAAKLTGAGGGGCVLTLLPTSILASNIHLNASPTLLEFRILSICICFKMIMIYTECMLLILCYNSKILIYLNCVCMSP